MASVARKRARGLFSRRKEKQRLQEEMHTKTTGVRIIETPVLCNAKKRYFVLTNALINFLVVMGTLGCFMDMVNVKYNHYLIMAAGVVFALFTALLYANGIFYVLGYLASFFGFIYGIIHLRYMARGGFGYICNDFMKFIEKEFALPIERSYEVYGYEEELSVTVCLIFILFASMLLLNMSISKAKNFEMVFLFTFPILQIGMYFDRKVSIIYFSMYMAGMLALFFLRNSSHCKMETRKKKGYQKRKHKTQVVFDYVTDGRYSLSFTLMIGVLTAVFSILIGLFSPQDQFRMSTRFDELKYNTREYVEKFALVGFWGMFNPDGNAGGVAARSKMGRSKYVRLDYEDDLIIRTFAQKGENHMYLRSFYGSVYHDAMWETLGEQKEQQATLADYDLTPKELEKLTATLGRYYGEKFLLPKKAIQIINVGAVSSYTYLPYQTSDDMNNIVTYVNDDEMAGGLPRNYIQISNYSPLKHIRDVDDFREEVRKANNAVRELAEASEESWFRVEVLDAEERYSDYVHEVYMQVPQENEETIRRFCEQYGLTKDTDHIVERLAKIFAEDYEYSLIPGVTPSDQEFVNYFLEKQKKGYCMYFATASTLILRYLGIPARFTGGYVLWNSYYPSGDPKEFSQEEKLENWVSISKYTKERYPYGLMEYKLDDSMAHAWVEIYIDGFGWIPVELTPPSEEDLTQQEEENAGVISFFANNVFTAANMRNVRKASVGLMVVMMAFFGIVVCVFVLVGVIVRYRRRHTSLVTKSFEYLCLCGRFVGLPKEAFMDYEEYGTKLTEEGIVQEEIIKKIIRILEKDKFSGKNAPEEETEFVRRQVNAVADQIYETLQWYRKIWYRLVKWL